MTLFTVGDTDQLMYRFNGAKPELLTEEIDRYIPSIQTYFLDTNYRSTSRIIEASKRLIAQNYSDAGGPYPQKFMKNTQPREDAPEGESVQFQMFPTARDEAQGVADYIVDLLANGYEPGHFYVGTRTRAQLAYLEGPLYRAKVKFVNITGGSFWQNFHVARIVGYLQLAHDTNNDAAFQLVYNIASGNYTDRQGKPCHHRWLGAEFLRLTKGRFGLMHLAIAANRRYYYGVKDLEDYVRDIQAEISYADSPVGPLNYIIENYRGWLKAQGELDQEDGDSSIADDIATILEVAGEYTSVEAFLGYVREMTEAAEKAKAGTTDDYVVLSTYHRLKGSERRVMVAMGWCEGVDPFGNRKGLLPHTSAIGILPQFGVLPTGAPSSVEDERCIAFVAVTRAKEKVLVTAPGEWRGIKMFPSRFVGELLGDMAQADGTDGIDL